LVKTEGEEPSSVSPAPQPAKVVATPEPVPEPEPVVVVEPEPEPEPEEASSVTVVQADGDIVPEKDADEEGVHVYDEAELTALTLPYIRPIAKKFGIDVTGMRKAEIITAIIDTQGS
jgi:hypothetical protein